MPNCSVKRFFRAVLALTLSVAALDAAKVDAAKDAVKIVKKESGKQPIRIQCGDTAFTVGGYLKVAGWYKKNNEMLNSYLPDEAQYIKNTFEVNFDCAYGEKTFEHKAVEAYVDVMNKSTWGLGSEYASDEAAGPGQVRISQSLLPKHAHVNSKPLIWIKDGWLRMSVSAIAGVHASNNLHFIQLGWFPFVLGRGIALGTNYGQSRELVGLFTSKEDKSAPGLLLTGEIVKDTLSYDVYYSKREERSNNLRNTLAPIKAQLIGHKTEPWRGVAKDNDLIAGRLCWKALDADSYGKLKLEPYVFYNPASDQKVEVTADSKLELGSVGFAAEHVYKNFEIGGEVAANFGQETVYAVDRNKIEVRRNSDGRLTEVFSKIYSRNDPSANLNGNATESAFVTTARNTTVASNDAAKKEAIDGEDPLATDPNFGSRERRLRPEYKNKLRGWMGVLDGAYTFQTWNLTLALAYGYVSGDKNPQYPEKNKTYKGFIGVDECYCGKRVKSIFYDERDLQVPASFDAIRGRVAQEMAFTNLQFTGLSATWKPAFAKAKKLSFNPNMLFYWKNYASRKYAYDVVTPRAGSVLREKASKFLGTELNVMVQSELLQDLKAFGTVATFIPGTYFKDIKGVPLDTQDYFTENVNQGVKVDIHPIHYRLGDDVAYLITAGMSYTF